MLQQRLTMQAARPAPQLPSAKNSSERSSRSRETTRRNYDSTRSNNNGSNACSKRDCDSSLHEAQKTDLLRAFETLDEDGDGRLSTQELSAACRTLGITGINNEKLQAMLLLKEKEDAGKGRGLDTHGKPRRYLSFEQFMRLCLPEPCCEKKGVEEEVQEVFFLLDRHSNGYITAADVLHAARAVNNTLDPADMELMIREAEGDAGKGVTFEDLQRVFQRVRGHHGVQLSLSSPVTTVSATFPSAASPRLLTPGASVAARSSTAASSAGGSSTTFAHPFRTTTAKPSLSPAVAAAPCDAAATALTHSRRLHSRSRERTKQPRFSVQKEDNEDIRK